MCRTIKSKILSSIESEARLYLFNFSIPLFLYFRESKLIKKFPLNFILKLGKKIIAVKKRVYLLHLVFLF